MYDTKHNAVLIRREGCSQLFLVFTGIHARVFGLGPLEFIRKAGLDDRNLVILNDPATSGFLAGCSETIDSFEALLAWQREIVADMPHVRHVHTIGISSGALAAILSASLLGGESSWIFGPRMHSLRQLATTERARGAGTDYELALTDRLLLSAQTWQARLRNLLRMTARESLPPPPVVDAWLRDFQPMLSQLKTANSAVHNLYYVPTNPIDSMIVDHLSRHCPGIRLHVVTPPDDYPREAQRRPGWDHLIIPIMIARQQLHSLFPPFRASRD
jgi:hypothetical protein